MQLENFDSAWKQLKLLNAMQHTDAKEILSIIDNTNNTDRTKLQGAIILVMFIAITIFCQGG